MPGCTYISVSVLMLHSVYWDSLGVCTMYFYALQCMCVCVCVCVCVGADVYNRRFVVAQLFGPEFPQ